MKLHDNPLFHIIHIGKVVEQKVTKQMQSCCNVTHADAKLLIVLGYNPKATQKALADALSVSAPAISRHIDKLEKKSWIQKVTNPESRRESSIELTKEGERLRNEVLEEFESTLREMLQDLPRLHKTTLQDLTGLTEALDKNENVARKIREGITNHK